MFDKITCRELEVVDAKGNKAVVLLNTKEGNGVGVYDKQGKGAIDLSSTEKWGNELAITDQQTRKKTKLGGK